MIGDTIVTQYSVKSDEFNNNIETYNVKAPQLQSSHSPVGYKLLGGPKTVIHIHGIRIKIQGGISTGSGAGSRRLHQ